MLNITALLGTALVFSEYFIKTLSYLIINTSFDRLCNMLTGPKLPFSERLPFLCAGVTFANFIHGGKRLASKDLLNSEYKASVKMSEVGLIIFVGISES